MNKNMQENDKIPADKYYSKEKCTPQEPSSNNKHQISMTSSAQILLIIQRQNSSDPTRNYKISVCELLYWETSQLQIN